MTRWRWTAAALAVILFSLWRVHTTHRVFSQTTDEPLHIAAGFDWWHGKVDFDVEHPPLARLMFGFPAAVLDELPDPGPGWIGPGNALLLANDRYDRISLTRGDRI